MTLADTNSDRFPGFPSSGLATAVPNLFFSRVLPQIERPEELIVSIYFFFAQQQKRRWPRFVTARELAADAVLVRSLARVSGEGEALEHALGLAVGRGTLVRTIVETERGLEQVYAVNTPSNLRGLEALSQGRLEVEEPLPPAEGTAEPSIFLFYEENIGSITPLIAEQLQEAEQRYPPEWLRQAFKEAVSVNKRSWRYVERILQRWETEGPSYEKPERDAGTEWMARRYAAGRRARAPRAGR